MDEKEHRHMSENETGKCVHRWGGGYHCKKDKRGEKICNTVHGRVTKYHFHFQNVIGMKCGFLVKK